jgi:hypothetical protein
MARKVPEKVPNWEQTFLAKRQRLARFVLNLRCVAVTRRNNEWACYLRGLEFWLSRDTDTHWLPSGLCARRHAEIEHVFPSPTVKDSPITEHALAVAMARFAANLKVHDVNSWTKEPPTPHGLRRTVATRLAAMGIPKEDRDAILNHTPRDVGKKHHDLYERDREKRIALTAWSEAILAILEKPGTGLIQTGPADEAVLIPCG